MRAVLSERLRERGLAGRVDVVDGFFERLPVPDGEADLVIACSAFTVRSGHGAEAGLEEMHRACAPGGLVVVVWPDDPAWLVARGFQHVVFPGEMAVEFADAGEAAELARVFAPGAVEWIERTGSRRVPYDVLGDEPSPRAVLAAGVRIAVLAPLVTPIAEPQIGGSQALLADLACGLAERGHRVRVYAASGSRIEGVEVVDTGVRAESLAATLFRAHGDGPAADDAAREAFERVGSMIADDRPDVVHAHAFDAPAVDVVAGLGLPAVQVLHLPPAAGVADAVRRAATGSVEVVTVSEAMRTAWAAAGVESRVIRPGVPVERFPGGPNPEPGPCSPVASRRRRARRTPSPLPRRPACRSRSWGPRTTSPTPWRSPSSRRRPVPPSWDPSNAGGCGS